MFEIIQPLRPYFHSLREIKQNVSLDIKLPVNWKYEKIVQVYKTIQIKVQDKNDKTVLISVISTATEEGYDTVFNCVTEIVNKNIEEEKKRKLFDDKVREMRAMFEQMDLEQLQNLKIKGQNVKDTYEEGLSLAGDGDEEGSDGDRESQEDDDQSTEVDE
jgi:hypothetical protein